MNEEQITPVENQEDTDYVGMINELRANTVPKDKYDRLKVDYDKAMRSLINGDKVEVEAPKTPEEINKLREIFTTENNVFGVEYWTSALEVREADMAMGRPDPFKGFGKMYQPDDADDVWPERVADVISQCLEIANGDDLVFANTLASRLNEGGIARPAKRGR
jgi:hypothetical protein